MHKRESENIIGGLGELLGHWGIYIYIYIFLEADVLMSLDAHALKCFYDHS